VGDGRGLDHPCRFELDLLCAELVEQPDAASQGLGLSTVYGIVTQSATILLVEDTDVVGNVTSQMLAAAGHTVMETSGPNEALEVCERHSGPIDLVLTDIVMPQMSGRELAKRIIHLHPDAKVLLMSGYAEQPAEDGDAGPLHAFLSKPFTSAQLTTKVGEALARDRSADSEWRVTVTRP
jgi:CheY-like chemotaxis protein